MGRLSLKFSRGEVLQLAAQEAHMGTEFDSVMHGYPHIRYYKGNELVKSLSVVEGYIEELGPGLYPMPPHADAELLMGDGGVETWRG